MKSIQDRGSTPLASTILRQGFGWQAIRLWQTRPWRRMPAIALATAGLRLLQPKTVHYVYLLRSKKFPQQRYIGLTNDLKARLQKHDEGGSPHTAKYRPWRLVTYFAFSTREQAAAFESYLKSGSGRAFANKRLW